MTGPPAARPLNYATPGLGKGRTHEMSSVSAAEMVRELERTQFYGSLEIKFEGGRAVLLRKTETIKPAERNYRDNRGATNEHDS
jgi:hypothetical protein